MDLLLIVVSVACAIVAVKIAKGVAKAVLWLGAVSIVAYVIYSVIA